MLELSNFGQINTSTILSELRDESLLVTSWLKNMTPKPLFQNTFVLKRPRVDNFTDIIKVATVFIKTTFRDSNKVKKLETMY